MECFSSFRLCVCYRYVERLTVILTYMWGNMKINLTPQRRDDVLVIERKGDSLVLNGHLLDFGPVPEGASLPAEATGCEWVVGEVERVGGILHISILLPHGPDAPESVRFPKPIVDPADGVVELPKWV